MAIHLPKLTNKYLSHEHIQVVDYLGLLQLLIHQE